MIRSHVVSDLVNVRVVGQAVGVHDGITVAIKGRCRGLHGEPGEGGKRKLRRRMGGGGVQRRGRGGGGGGDLFGT